MFYIFKKCKKEVEAVVDENAIMIHRDDGGGVLEEKNIVAENNNNDDDPTKALFEQKFVPRGWPKLQFQTKRIRYKFPDKRTRQATGFGEACGFCRCAFAHGNARSPRSPVYIQSCRHLICGACITLHSRPVVANLNAITRASHPYVISSDFRGVKACPACNAIFEWTDLYYFYL